MRAVVFEDKLRYVCDYEKPKLKDGWALVKINQAGICRTDLEITKGYLGFKGIPGHEFIGVVEECSDSNWLGKRVTGEINFACGTCKMCSCNLDRHCPNRTVLGIMGANGCMCDYCLIPVKNLFGIPEYISDDKAVFIEPLSAGSEILEQLNNHYHGDEKVIVLGDGKLGILCAWVLSTVFSDVMLAGHHQDKLELADWNGVRTTKNICDSELYDIVVEATGTLSGFESAMNICRPKGRIILKSTLAAGGELNLAGLVINELTVTGSRCGQFKDGLSILEKYHDIPLERLITATFPAEKALEAFEKSKEKNSLKVILDFSYTSS